MTGNGEITSIFMLTLGDRIIFGGKARIVTTIDYGNARFWTDEAVTTPSLLVRVLSFLVGRKCYAKKSGGELWQVTDSGIYGIRA